MIIWPPIEKRFFYWVWEWRSILSYFLGSEDMVTKWMKKFLTEWGNGYPQLNFICKQWGNGNHMRKNNSFWVGEWISTTIFQWQSVIIWPPNERKIFLLSMGMEIHPQLLFKQWGYGNQMNEIFFNWVREWIPTTKFHMQTVGKWQPDERK